MNQYLANQMTQPLVPGDQDVSTIDLVRDNGRKPAYPEVIAGTDGSYSKGGLTKREYFAAMAMQGLCANSIPGKHHDFAFLTGEAVRYADALLSELSTT